MEDNKTLIYWLDATGSEDFDEIVRLTIIDTDNKVLFNSTFCTKLVDWWYSELNGIRPEDTYEAPLLDKYKNEIQSIFNKASKLITFNQTIEYLKRQGITISTNTVIEDLADRFRVMGDDTDTIDNLCIYYGYPLPNNILNRTGVDYAKAINFCWHKMEIYRQAQEN
ncbi:MAG: hypothetical protein ACI4UB_07370 [Limosilactobacillus sp.]